ncbi:MAG: hypothetical protein OXP68_02685 [Anaerolineaceae bacterium]|nr:hypothetical protein [Anaerolineaceae bacterium]MDE0328086.1 hypothetical protein [Anaerolineaceae bacterium]
MLTAADYFDLDSTALAGLFADTDYVWQAVARIEPWIERRFAAGLQPGHDGAVVARSAVIGPGPVYIGPGTVVGPGACIEGPAIIGAGCEIRHGALLRPNTILGDGAVVGHASETKNALLLEQAAAPHFAYVGDSILGQRVNLGAGTKLSNVGITSRAGPDAPRRHILLHCVGVTYDSGLTKLGAIIGDDVETGCNCVTNPGVLIGPRTLVYALTSLAAGCYPADHIIKLRQTQRRIVRRR